MHYEKIQAPIGFGTEKQTKYVGRRRLQDPLSLERLAKEISHNTGQQQAACETTLRYMVLAVEDAIMDGRSVDIGIGTLSPTISTVAADQAEDVKIRKKRVLFRASKQLRTIVDNMSVKLITDSDDDDTDTEPEGGDNKPTGGGTGQNTTGGGTDSGDSGGLGDDDGPLE
jgi:predicted histone-like DNA-binding protein